jgi:hypothetical protein
MRLVGTNEASGVQNAGWETISTSPIRDSTGTVFNSLGDLKSISDSAFTSSAWKALPCSVCRDSREIVSGLALC